MFTIIAPLFLFIKSFELVFLPCCVECQTHGCAPRDTCRKPIELQQEPPSPPATAHKLLPRARQSSMLFRIFPWTLSFPPFHIGPRLHLQKGLNKRNTGTVVAVKHSIPNVTLLRLLIVCRVCPLLPPTILYCRREGKQNVGTAQHRSVYFSSSSTYQRERLQCGIPNVMYR